MKLLFIIIFIYISLNANLVSFTKVINTDASQNFTKPCLESTVNLESIFVPSTVETVGVYPWCRDNGFPLPSNSSFISRVYSQDIIINSCTDSGSSSNISYTSRETFVCNFDQVCTNPTGNSYGVYDSSVECNTALISLSSISDSSSLACGCFSSSGSVTLYGSPDLTCSSGYSLSTINGVSSCEPDTNTTIPPDINTTLDPNGDSDGDGIPNINDPDSPLFNADDVGSNNCPPLLPLYTIVAVEHSNCTVAIANRTLYNEVDYLKYVSWDTCRNTCIVKFGSCPRGESYRDGSCKKPLAEPCSGTLSCIIEGSSGALNVSKSSTTTTSDTYPLMGCYEECKCDVSVVSINSVSCDDKDPGSTNTPDTNTPDTNSTINPNDNISSLLTSTGKSNDLLTDLNKNSKDIISKLDKLNLDNKESMSKQLAQLKTNGKKSDDTNVKLATISTSLKSLNTINSKISKDIASLNQNQMATTKALNDGLFGDDPFVDVDFTDDGSDSFSALGTQISDEFSNQTEYNIFGLANSSSATLPTYSVNFHGNQITFFNPSMLNDFPITEMRSLIMFLFCLAGFAHTFRTT